MKAIVANVLFGSILGCLSWADYACAKPIAPDAGQLEVPASPVLSAKLFSSDKLPLMPQIINLVDRIFTIKQSKSTGYTVDREGGVVFRDRFSLNLNEYRDLKLNKVPYTHRDENGDVILGFQDTFWQSDRPQKYWGVTTIEHWGNSRTPKGQLNLAKLNYTNLAPALPAGNSMLTVSGGGNKNLVRKDTEDITSREFEKFRGAVSYHHGLGENVTVGTGFIYEDSLVGFSQLTYGNDNFPLKTTVSLRSEESGGVDFRSHMRFKPADSFVLNYYHDSEQDKFDANWRIVPGLTLTANGNSKEETIAKGIKVAINNEYMSVSAKATLDGENNLQWKLKSNIGGLKISHSNNAKKSSSELDLDLLESQNTGFQCTAFVKYETKTTNKNENEFTVWGGKLQSQSKITADKHLWSVNLGYGSGSHGNGLIASGSFALQPSLFLKLSYQEVSATSDDNKIELKLSSK